MAAYATFEQRLLRKKRRKKFFNFTLLFLMLNYVFTKLVMQIFTFQGEEMLPLITKNHDLVFVSKYIRFFSVPFRVNDIVLYEKLASEGNVMLDFFRDLFCLSKIFNTKKYSVSRIVSTWGDSVYVRGFDILVNRGGSGSFYLNGTFISNYKLNNFFKSNEPIKCFTLKKNEFFLLNENLKILNDSRVFGPIKKDKMKSFLILKVMDYRIVR
ncbi:signal peptidase I [Borrelia sp. BU AG58]|uniref:signal peptidase I n=1 Tax=Borrelia sp. BU AG58 TaxID=2887345 RepID=UPI001E344F94|nr:signal peptidase I [Borrelia sp. BU AG58]UER67254.1 signal peptidase I [Borrelia sp. BU AG58]